MIFILAPYYNYSISVYHNSTFSYLYEPISISPNEGQNIGQFLNHEPSITSYSASPSTVLPTNSTIIIITASDPDPLDILTYSYIPSMGSIIGSGNNVTYQAPGVTGFFYLNISVIDPHGGYDNITRSVSARTTTVSVNVTDFEDEPMSGNLVQIIDWTTGIRLSYAYTDSNGFVIFPNVPESYYYLTAQAANNIQSEIFISGNSPYDYNFKFGALFVNSTGGNHVLITTAVTILLNGSTTTEGSGNTGLIDKGQIRFDLRPDIYDIRGQEINYLFYRDIEIVENSLTNLTFNWAEFNITTRSVMDMPLTSLWEVYNSTTGIRYIYGYAPTSTGQDTIYAAPGTDYQIRIRESNIIYLDIVAIANEISHAEGRFGVIRVTQSDEGGNPLSVSISVLNSTTDATIASTGTGGDGVCFFSKKETTKLPILL